MRNVKLDQVRIVDIPSLISSEWRLADATRIFGNFYFVFFLTKVQTSEWVPGNLLFLVISYD